MQVMKPLSVGFVVYILTFGLYVNSYIYRMMASYPLIVPAAFLLPWCGFGLGFVVSLALRQSRSNSVAIAIETGIQNYSIAMVVLLGAFPKPYGDLAAVMPMIVAHFTPLPLFTAFIIFTIRDKVRAKR
jgi:predicted Na+-dependent transporter